MIKCTANIAFYHFSPTRYINPINMSTRKDPLYKPGHLNRKRISEKACEFDHVISFYFHYLFGLIRWRSSNACPSVRCCRLSDVVVTLTFLNGFLPNFIYGLLPSNSPSSSNMGFVRRTITKIADKMAATYQFACCGHSNFVILISFLPNFIYGLLLSNSSSSSNMGFVQPKITEIADKMAATYQFACCGLSDLVIFSGFFQISYMDCFYQTLAQV